MRNKVVAALLAFIGGTFGLHKFYLRDPGAGVFYIFLTFMTSRFFPISTFLGFIDGLRYLMMPPEEFDRKFNQRYSRRRTRVSRRTSRQEKKRDHYEEKRKKSSMPKKMRQNPFKRSGLRKYKEYEIEEAIDDFKKGLKLEPNDIALHFNLSCAYSLLENKDEAYYYLDQAVKKGLKDFDKVLSHDDLAFIRIQPEFDSFKKNGFQLNPAERRKEEKRPMEDILLAQLNRLMELRKKGVLTENEYVVERKKILSR